LLAAGFVLAGLAAVAWLTGRPPSRPNVLLITLDTTRADALGAYGAPSGSTPVLDALASRSLVFERAWTPVPLTLPAHASILTGLYPRSHGVRRNGAFRLPDGTPTLATLLRDAGYSTAAFVSSVVLNREFGLAAGFDLYDDLSETNEKERRATEVASEAIAWLRARPQQPFLLWIHFYDPHAPYEPPSPFRERFVDPYAGEVALVDSELGRVLSALDGEGLSERTVVVVASDHGEDRLQHGEPEHGILLYESVLHVPLLVRLAGPAARGARIAARASLVDVCPTILDVADVPFPSTLQGRPLLRDPEAPRAPQRELLAESTLPASDFGWSPLEALVRGDWKLIEAPSPELYDLATDRWETMDLAVREADLVRGMRDRLAMVRVGLAPPAGSAAHRAGAAARAALEALGYVQRLREPVARAAPGPDPKTVIGVLPRLKEAHQALRRGDPAAAVPELQSALAIDPKNPQVLSMLGLALHGTGRHEEARRALEAALERHPDDPGVLTDLGIVLEAFGDRLGAERAYRRAVTIDPASETAQLNLLLVLFDSGRPAEALAQAAIVRRQRPDHPRPLLVAGRCREALGDPEGAVREFRQVLQLAERWPDSADVQLGGAEAAFRLGDAALGEEIARRFLARHPEAESRVRRRLGEWRGE
jgi:arylsulfatase A-like enzyme/tetratricopeptide (TPR) repeat protein